jgi:hypothetical protein
MSLEKEPVGSVRFPDSTRVRAFADYTVYQAEADLPFMPLWPVDAAEIPCLGFDFPLCNDGSV